MYERRSRLNPRQQAELIKFFVAGATARAAGEIAGVIATPLPRISCASGTHRHASSQLSLVRGS